MTDTTYMDARDEMEERGLAEIYYVDGDDDHAVVKHMFWRGCEIVVEEMKGIMSYRDALWTCADLNN